MTYASVCSGIEAPTVAWHGLGWRAAWFSEIDAFPSAVLAHHYPHVRNRSDMTAIVSQLEAEHAQPGAIDLLVGGTPCQSFSIAGLRKGLADPRGNLALVFLAIADRARPRWLVWENVPGVLSSSGGRDFGSFLGALGQLGYGFAYRILDAQFFGVAQRRRRVFVVGHLGDWRRAAAVLFERASLSGNPPPCREARKDVAPSLAARTRGGGGLGTDAELDGALIAHSLGAHQGQRNDPHEQDFIVAHALKADGFDGSEISVFDPNQVTSKTNRSRCEPGPSHTLPARGNAPVAFGRSSGVRRLTPEECEALQAFPRGYTLIPYRGKPAADGPRYKALGNSMCVTVMRWIGDRIAAVEDLCGA